MHFLPDHFLSSAFHTTGFHNNCMMQEFLPFFEEYFSAKSSKANVTPIKMFFVAFLPIRLTVLKIVYHIHLNKTRCRDDHFA